MTKGCGVPCMSVFRNNPLLIESWRCTVAHKRLIIWTVCAFRGKGTADERWREQATGDNAQRMTPGLTPACSLPAGLTKLLTDIQEEAHSRAHSSQSPWRGSYVASVTQFSLLTKDKGAWEICIPRRMLFEGEQPTSTEGRRLVPCGSWGLWLTFLVPWGRFRDGKRFSYYPTNITQEKKK